jgi:hypothetical protein
MSFIKDGCIQKNYPVQPINYVFYYRRTVPVQRVTPLNDHHNSMDKIIVSSSQQQRKRLSCPIQTMESHYVNIQTNACKYNYLHIGIWGDWKRITNM